MSKAGRQQLKNELWRACDVMRSDGNCNGAKDYVEHLTWLLILKYLDRTETSLRDRVDAIDKRYRWKHWVGKFIGTKLPDGNRVLSVLSETALMQFVKDDLIPYLASLSGTPEKDVIANVFADRNAVICNSPRNLKDLIAIIDNLDFIDENSLSVCAEFYEELLQKFGREDISLGEFVTPPAVAHLVVQILNPKIEETVYDPSCGSGTLLVEAYKYLREQERYLEQTGGMPGHLLTGLEKKPVAALIGSMNVALHGLWGCQIHHQNALESNDADIPQYFDVVITNPPFGVNANVTIQNSIRGGRKSGEVLFVDHVMRKLRPRDGSRCGMIVSDGVLYRQGYFKDTRKKLIDHFNISLIVSLPSGCFSYTAAKTSIIFFNLPGPTAEVLYCEIGIPKQEKASNKKNRISEDDFAAVFEVWNRWQAYLRKEASRPILPEYCWTVMVEELKERNYDLSARPPNRIDRFDSNISTPELITRLAADSHEFTLAVERLFRLINNSEEL
jgi:type I restriction enzyme M protein